jgi:glycine dehydrogenase subunit 1
LIAALRDASFVIKQPSTGEVPLTATTVTHPWMANSVPAIKEAMLAEVGAASIEELLAQIPASHRLKRPLDLPPGLRAEADLRRRLTAVLARNETCEENLSFLGAGCWQHHVPAVVDEIVNRYEFMTNVWGSPQSDVGRNQAWFEYASQLGELLSFEVVSLPVYSWGCAAGHAIRMASRLTGRHEVLLPKLIDPERLAVIRSYCEPREMARHIDVVLVEADPEHGRLDLADLERKLSSRTAAVYLETPSYIGVIEAEAAEIARLAHRHGAQMVAGVDPISLGVLKAPGDWGADIAVGPTQPLGVHMNCGGGVGGFMASRDEERYVREYNGFLVSVVETARPGELGFALCSSHQTSYGMREQGKDWTGNSVYLWAIANAVYMSLLGPEGFREVGTAILQRGAYAMRQLALVPGVGIPFCGTFKEFVVDFSATGKTVAAINESLRRHKIFGGKDLSAERPDWGQSALWCVTEIHTKSDIDRAVAAIEEAVR